MPKYLWPDGLKCLLMVCTASAVCMVGAKQDSAATLRATYAAMDASLQHNPFKRPLVLDSVEKENHLTGDIYAVVDYPFGAVRTGLNDPDHWCDVMLLHINTKYCHAMVGPSGTTLRVNVGKKTPEALANVPRVEFNYTVAAVTPEYLEILLGAKDGPLGTSDYRIELEALALPNAKTFLHLTYSYTMGFAARLAMQTYLSTVGSSKVGFTITGRQANGQPDYIGGVRGVVERNAMRYYLAIDSYLGAASAAPAKQLDKRLQDWFTAVEQYPRQLHEMDREPYLQMKRAEYARQQTVR